MGGSREGTEDSPREAASAAAGGAVSDDARESEQGDAAPSEPIKYVEMGSEDCPVEITTNDDNGPSIYVNMQRIRKVSGVLPHAQQLKAISMISCMLDDIEEVAECEQLTYLDLYQNRITDVGPLTNLLQLRYLDLSFNNIRRINSLHKLINLESLAMTANKIVKVEGLRDMKRLKMLELGSNRLRVLPAAEVEPMQLLEQLWLGKNKITSMALPFLGNLRIVSFQANRLREWSDDLFQKCPKLEEAYFSENQIAAPPLLSGEKSELQILDVGKNVVTTLDNFTQFQSLTDLWLNENKISSLDEVRKLQGLPNLRTLYLEGNPFQADLGPGYRQAVLQILPNLQQLDAIVIRR